MVVNRRLVIATLGLIALVCQGNVYPQNQAPSKPGGPSWQETVNYIVEKLRSCICGNGYVPETVTVEGDVLTFRGSNAELGFELTYTIPLRSVAHAQYNEKYQKVGVDLQSESGRLVVRDAKDGNGTLNDIRDSHFNFEIDPVAGQRLVKAFNRLAELNTATDDLFK
jgi:hypothetical protein